MDIQLKEILLKGNIFDQIWFNGELDLDKEREVKEETREENLKELFINVELHFT